MSPRATRSVRARKRPLASKKRHAKAGTTEAHEHSHPHSHGAHQPDHSHGHVHTDDAAHGHHHDHDPVPSGGPALRSRNALAESARAAEAHRAALPEGAGRGKTLFLDAASGIAGDMTIAALVDLGVPLAVVERAVSALPLRGVGLSLQQARAGAIGASRFEVCVASPQPERGYRDIDRMLEKAKLSPRVKELARRIFLRLGEAEAETHRIPLDDVHFHEVGAVDAIVDIVGAAACFVHLGAEVISSPLPLGRGFVACRHGILPLPAPATVACLRSVPTYDAGIEAELVTPTGASIVATVARRFERWPSMEPEHIGWGAGTRVLPDRPNALRVILGASTAGEIRTGAPSGTHVVLEANLDDATGELIGHAITALLTAGALDAWATPVTMKKGRPAIVLSALARHTDAARIAEVVLCETPSLGVRYAPVQRVERPREMRTVITRFGEIPVKVSGGPYGEPVVKPEFDACVEAAAKAGVSVRDVLSEALRVAENPRTTAPSSPPFRPRKRR